MQSDNFISAKHKITDFGFKTGTFKGDDGRDIDYTTLVVRIVVDGKTEDLPLSGQNAIKPSLLRTVLRGVTNVPQGTILDDKENASV